MNYRHAFHAGNHADVLKHVVLLALCDALVREAGAAASRSIPMPGAGCTRSTPARRSAPARPRAASAGCCADGAAHPAIARYLAAIDACRAAHGARQLPRLALAAGARAARAGPHRLLRTAAGRSRGAARRNFAARRRASAVQQRDGYAAMKALLPPRIGEHALSPRPGADRPALRSAAGRVRHRAGRAARCACSAGRRAMYALWYPIKLRRSLQPFYRRAATLPAKSALRRRTAGARRRLAAAHERQRPADPQSAVATRSGAPAGAARCCAKALGEKAAAAARSWSGCARPPEASRSRPSPRPT